MTGEKAITVRDLIARKGGEKIVMVSAYDAMFARIADEAGVDVILVGDSLANIVAGQDSTLRVTLDQMIYHGQAARRGCSRALLVVDMPFMTYQVSSEDAMRNAGRIMQETGAQAVKLEGGSPARADAVAKVVEMGVPVMGHLGFTPQSVHALGGARVQGKGDAAGQALVDDAKRLEDAGAFAVVLELVPAALAARVTEAIHVPTIGIGAGAGCDGQVLVLPDLLGLNGDFAPRFLKRYAELGAAAGDAVRRFVAETRDGSFPDEKHSY
ncbi:MAG TPA: 3-methyl-2-oxobutanoate hydroxymethyltransferase [Gemmatimonadaceae bacterium]|nr:3-methyl-2-oxobutanoate hydroxymethyltransferase [Gemmatimonadaceae bacterium]